MLPMHIKFYVNVGWHANVAVEVCSKTSLSAACTSAYTHTYRHTSGNLAGNSTEFKYTVVAKY